MRSILSAKLMISAALVVAAGCGTGDTSASASASGAGGAADAGNDGPNFCGQCAPGPPSGWADPIILWIGAEKDAPECPLDAPALAYEGHADLDAPLDCGMCSCTSPTGSCTLPGTMTANAASCALNGSTTPHTTFDPAASWSGACDTSTAIASGKLCSGVDCVQSLTVGPLSITESGCTPSTPKAQAAPTWQTFARGCQAVPRYSCNGGQGICLATSPPGFRVCVYQKGDNDCSGPVFAEYSDKHVFYDSFDDSRACSACSCDPPTGSTCSSKVSIYSDGACSTLLYSATVDSTGAACHDLTPGAPLGSKSATTPTYKAGTCTPKGGAASGMATPVSPSTLCCIPPG